MVEPEPRVTAELAYQRALTALHEAREELDDVAAARRRYAYDRPRLDPGEAHLREEALGHRFQQASRRVEALRAEAARLREQVRRLDDSASAEPVDVPPGTAVEGFEQPPYPTSPC